MGFYQDFKRHNDMRRAGIALLSKQCPGCDEPVYATDEHRTVKGVHFCSQECADKEPERKPRKFVTSKSDWNRDGKAPKRSHVWFGENRKLDK